MRLAAGIIADSAIAAALTALAPVNRLARRLLRTEQAFSVRGGECALRPGCMVIESRRGKDHFCTVVCMQHHFARGRAAYEMVVVENGKVRCWVLWETDRDRKWRVSE